MASLLTNFVRTLCYLVRYIITPRTTEFAKLSKTCEAEARTNCQLRHARQANRRKLYSDRPDHKKDFITAIQL